jgi:hypothetical protein
MSGNNSSFWIAGDFTSKGKEFSHHRNQIGHDSPSRLSDEYRGLRMKLTILLHLV